MLADQAPQSALRPAAVDGWCCACETDPELQHDGFIADRHLHRAHVRTYTRRIAKHNANKRTSVSTEWSKCQPADDQSQRQLAHLVSLCTAAGMHRPQID